ncbi:ubiquinone anaerobic biosynthesis accessory factor UbiT [Motiliproteus sediminis]|uniref:ubiquinone anaerobic biosynthesis accessory factor UbiT n=1 Tax=Motiliproteus sediminis TaxID=1468178 RepID=UPI001AEFB2B4|nr:SCP2 sterol-binding domain-containing protein [Motiliproteus sediminis]
MLKLPALPLPTLPLPSLPAPRQLVQRLPLLMATQARRIPFSVQRRLLEESMSRAFQEPLDDGDFDFLQDRWLKVEISDIGLAWFITYDEDRLLVARDEQADATIRGNLKEFLLLASRSEDPDTLFFQRRLMIEGDTEVGLEAKNLMDGVDHDNLPAAIKMILTRCADLAQRFF